MAEKLCTLRKYGGGGMKEVLVNSTGQYFSLVKKNGTIYSTTSQDMTIVNNNSDYFEMYIANNMWNYKIKEAGKYTYYGMNSGTSGVVSLAKNQVITHNPFNMGEYFVICRL